MCQEPTELLGVGCLTELILCLKFRFGTFDTEHQLADLLNKCNFTLDEWNNLPHFVQHQPFQLTCCAEHSSLLSCPNTMAKRMQEQKEEEERSVAKSKSTQLFRKVLHPNSPLASQEEPESRMRGNSESDVASSCQARLKDAYFGGLMEEQPRGNLSLRKRNQEMWIFPNLKLGGKKMRRGNPMRPVKWSWLIQWMNCDLRHPLVVFQCRILKYLMRGLLQH